MDPASPRRNCPAFENATARVVDMIVRQSAPNEILRALCHGLGDRKAERQVAIFLLERDRWNLAAKGDLTRRSEELLALIVPEAVSAALLSLGGETGSDAAPAGVLCKAGWARHLYSGPGELLGLFVCLSSRGSDPGAEKKIRIDAVCRLGALAIEQRNLLEELAWQVDHDAATGLFTRSCFERALQERLAGVAGKGGIVYGGTALLNVDLDRFRLVNEVLGYSVGNRVLKQVAMRFRQCLPPNAVLARIGGDEFAVLSPACTDRDMAAGMAERIMAALAEPVLVDEHELFVTASIGIGCSRSGSTPESLQREANIAAYHAKHTGKSRWAHFHQSMATAPPERLEMEKCLRSALSRREMLLYYQPQIDLRSGAILGAEVLLRWKPEGLGTISPGAFVPILEETGLIVEFGRWVLLEACRQGKLWGEATGRWLRLAVNVSALQFLHPGFASDIERILSETGFPPHLLELELTESLFIGDFDKASALFRKLQETGVTLAIDDFGTGQSSLSYLQRLPFQRLKIDQAFVGGIAPGDKRPPLVENIVGMAGSLGMQAIAEGVDHAYQAHVLRALGCDQAQGYLFAVPLPAEEFSTTWETLGARALALMEGEPATLPTLLRSELHSIAATRPSDVPEVQPTGGR